MDLTILCSFLTAMYTYVHYTETLGRMDVQDMFFCIYTVHKKTKPDKFLHYFI